MRFLMMFCITIFLTSCGANKSNTVADDLVWEISSELADCEGIAVQKCMQIRKKGDSKWSLFYDTIKGFDYNEGTGYTIKLRKNEVSNFPANGSSISYDLIDILKEGGVVKKNLKPSFRGYFVITHINTKETQLKDLSFKIDYQKRRVYGFSGCNNYSVPFLSSGEKLKFDPVTSTRKSCDDRELIEKEFHSVFKKVRSYTIVNGELTLFNKKGIEVMRGKKGSSY